MPSSPRWLGREAILAIHEAQVAEHGGGAGIRDSGALDSALARPQQWEAYQPETDIPTFGALYAIAIIRNHPFIDGNKRTGLVALELFLNDNGYTLAADDAECVTEILALAAGERTDDEMIAWVRRCAQL